MDNTWYCMNINWVQFEQIMFWTSRCWLVLFFIWHFLGEEEGRIVHNCPVFCILASVFPLGAARPLTQLKSPSNQSYPQQPTIISIVYTPFQRREKKTLDLIWKYLNALQNLQFCAFVTFHYNLAMINIALPVKQRNVTLLNMNRV